MKQELLALVGCIAATASTTSVAEILPEKLVGLNLGEIRSNSFLNQPFKGVIPFLFTSYEKSKDLNVGLAPDSIFNTIGAEKHPILNKLHFQITEQNNAPVILISSNQPINLPFLNFILEIKGPNSTIYQDYTVLLDPQSQEQSVTANVEYIDVESSEPNDSYQSKDFKSSDKYITNNDEDLLRANGALLLANLASKSAVSKNQKQHYLVKSGDSLSKIAKKHSINNASLKTVSAFIFQKNPKAFIRGNLNRLKKGAILNLPTASEVNGFDIVSHKVNTPNNLESPEEKNQKSHQTNFETYTVLKGENLSTITKKIASKDFSLANMMKTIYDHNPNAFINKDINRIKAGAKLSIPSTEEILISSETNNNSEALKPSAVTKIENISEIKKNDLVEESISNVEVELKPNQYKIREGDTLSYITNKVGYKEVPFAKMLKAIHTHNPDSFVNGKMAELKKGSIITLPPISSIQATLSDTAIKPELKDTTQSQKPNNVASDNLTKRIRELRKELQQAKENLSELKSNLNNKETLLEQKNIQLDSLNTLLTKFEKNIDPAVISATAIKTNVASEIIVDKNYKPKSKAEMAKLIREQLNRKEKTINQLNKIQEVQEQTISPISSVKSGESEILFKKYKSSSILNLTNTNYAYLTMALFLSLLLIRYRRELYNYTYSAISYDQPKYYPLPESDIFELKEQNINYHDAKMDEDPSNYESFPNEQISEKVSISPHLVEATKNIFETTEEAKQIEHCEHLVTELFDDLVQEKDDIKNTDWEDIEKVCDTYIEKIKDSDVNPKNNEDEALLVDATDFNHMMSDLLESLEKVDKSVKDNNISDDDFPTIVNPTLIEPVINPDRF